MLKFLGIIVLFCAAVVLVTTVIQMFAPLIAVLFLGVVCWKLMFGASSSIQPPES